MRDLYYDELQKDANHLAGNPIPEQLLALRALYAFLRRGYANPGPNRSRGATPSLDRYKLGNFDVVRACREYLTILKLPKFKFKSPERELNHYLRAYPWVLGELISDAMHQQAKVHFYKTGVMYVFLKMRYTRKQILEDLLWLVRTQQSSRKSLGLELELRGSKSSTTPKRGISTVR